MADADRELTFPGVRNGLPEPVFDFGFADLFEGFGGPMIVTDDERRILWINEGFCRLFDLPWEASSLFGTHAPDLADIVARRLAEPDRFGERIQEIVDRAERQQDEVIAADGRVLRRTYWPVHRHGTVAAHVWRYEDHTDEWRRAEALDRATAVLEELVWAHGTAIRERSGAELFGDLLDALIRVTASEYGFIGEISIDDRGNPYLTSWATTNIAWDDATRAFYAEQIATHGFLEFRNLDTLFGVTLRTGEPVFSDDPMIDPRAGGLPTGHPPLVSYLGVPIHRDGRMIGMVGLAGRPGGYPEYTTEMLQPLLAAAGSLIDAFAIERERRAAETALREALLAAERANAAKSRLLGRVSHELRTPLNAVLGFAELLEHGEDDPVRRQWVERIRDAGRHVLAEVNDLIDLSAAEAGRLSVRLTTVDVADVAGTVVAMIAPMSASAHVRVRSSVPAGTLVVADESRLQTVLVNLVSNAVKFNAEGGSVELTATADGDHVLIGVADDGPGIPADEIGDAFGMFERLGADARRVPGAGLGLTIATEYTAAMGGTLAATPRTPQGIEFTIRLPVPERPTGTTTRGTLASA